MTSSAGFHVCHSRDASEALCVVESLPMIYAVDGANIGFCRRINSQWDVSFYCCLQITSLFNITRLVFPDTARKFARRHIYLSSLFVDLHRVGSDLTAQN